MKTTLIVDGDTLIYAACSNTEHPIDWGSGMWTLHGWLPEALEHFNNDMKVILEGTGTDRAIVGLSDYSQPYWRKEIMPSYKGNRVGGRKPVTYFPLRDAVGEEYETYVRPALEGDDIVGILGTHPRAYPGRKIMVGIDKDLLTIPGLHVNYDHARRDNELEPLIVTKYDADYRHMLQTLMGDSTDGYTGVPGIGPKTAAAILEDSEPDEWWDLVVEAYEDKELTEEHAIITAQVARICRAEDFDLDTKEVRLWQPSQ